MTVYFHKTSEINGSNLVKKSNMILRPPLSIGNDDKNCFLWSTLVHLQPCENSHPYIISIHTQYSHEMNLDKIDFSNGYKSSNVT